MGLVVMDRFLELFSINEPIVQAPIGSMATIELVKAVARGGGLGSLACTWMDFATIKRAIATLHSAQVPYFLNFVMHFQRSDFREIFDLGVKAVQFSWGCDPDLVSEAKSRGIKVGIQIGHPAAVASALASGCDFIIVQGCEAGGHVQSTRPLSLLLPTVIAQAGPTPVVAAGGIASPAQARAAVTRGASGIMMGTRFLASNESCAHALYKKALCSANASDTVFTNCFDEGWPHAMHRVLRNSTLERWEAAGCPQSSRRPGEHDIILDHANGQQSRRYADIPPCDTDTGQVMEACLYSGTGIDDIEDIVGAARIVERMSAALRSF